MYKIYDKADGKPMAIPMEMEVPETIEDKMKRIIATQISINAEKHGQETWDDAHDFDVKEPFEFEPDHTKYEIMDDEFPDTVASNIRDAAQARSGEPDAVKNQKEGAREGDPQNPPSNDSKLPVEGNIESPET